MLLRLRAPARSAETELLDTFFVSAIATVLIIRLFLEATGYPRLGGGGLHVAHVLWGGLGMLAAIVLLLAFVSPATRHLAALLGGAGFGAFIDELGKFVTSDNDYFFKPTAALIYALFVALYFLVRQIRVYRGLTPAEDLANAIDIAEGFATGEMTSPDRERALELLARADQSDPFVPLLRERFLAHPPAPRARTVFDRLGSWIGERYARIAGTTAFRRVIIGLFAVQGVSLILSVIAALVLLGGAAAGIQEARADLDEATGGSPVTSFVQFVAGIAGGGLIVLGLLAVRRSRRRTYRLFELAVLVDLLLVQPFQFLDLGFGPAFDVLFDLALLAILRNLDALEGRIALRKLERESAMALAAAPRGGRGT